MGEDVPACLEQVTLAAAASGWAQRRPQAESTMISLQKSMAGRPEKPLLIKRIPLSSGGGSLSAKQPQEGAVSSPLGS